MSDRWHHKAREPVEEAISRNVPAYGAEVTVQVFGGLFRRHQSVRIVRQAVGEAMRHAV